MFESKIIGMAPSARLGQIRFVVVLCALVNVVFHDFDVLAQAVRAWYSPPGILQWIPQFPPGLLFNSEMSLLLFKAALIFVLGLSLIGFQTYASLSLATFLYGLFLGTLRSSTASLDNGILPLYLMFIMIWIPSGEGFSLDQKFRQDYPHLKLDDRPSSAMAWSVFLMRAAIAFSYFQAGIAKLQNTGLGWVRPWRLQQWMIEDSLIFFHPSFALRLIELPGFFWGALSSAYLALELFFPVILLFSKGRAVYLLAAVLVRSFVLAPQDIFFHDLILLQFAFYDWDRIFPSNAVPLQDRRKGKPISEGSQPQ